MKPKKVRLMLYLRVLLKYLQRKNDPEDTYARLQMALHECAAKSRRREKGYESLTTAMQRVIREIVAQEDLVKARGYMNLYVHAKNQIVRHRDVKAFKSLDPNASWLNKLLRQFDFIVFSHAPHLLYWFGEGDVHELRYKIAHSQTDIEVVHCPKHCSE